MVGFLGSPTDPRIRCGVLYPPRRTVRGRFDGREDDGIDGIDVALDALADARAEGLGPVKLCCANAECRRTLAVLSGDDLDSAMGISGPYNGLDGMNHKGGSGPGRATRQHIGVFDAEAPDAWPSRRKVYACRCGTRTPFTPETLVPAYVQAAREGRRKLYTDEVRR